MLKKGLKRTALIILVLFLVCMLILTYLSSTINSLLLPQITVANAQTGSFSSVIEQTLTPKYRTEQTCFSPVSVWMDSVNLNYGKRIAKGNVIGKCNLEQIGKEKELLSTQCRKYEADLSILENSLRNFAGTSTEKRSLQANIDAMQLSVDQTEDTLEQIERLFDSEGNMLAPVDGIITEVYIEEFAVMGQSSPIFRYAESQSPLYLEWTEEIEAAKDFNVGSSVYLSYEALDSETEILVEKSLKCRITEKTANADSGKVSFVIDIPEDATDITLTTNVTVLLQADSKRYECIVPKSSVIEMDNRYSVYTVTMHSNIDELTVKIVPVEVLDSNEYYYALDTRFNNNTYVITSSTKSLSDNIEVILK